LGRVPRSDQSRRIPVLWACCPGVGAVAAFAGMARARDRSSLHAVRKENNGRKSWFRFSTVSFSPFSSFILPAAGLTTLAACSAAPAARARACVPEVPARSLPASAGLGRAGSLPRWPWPRRPCSRRPRSRRPRPHPCPRPRPPASASASACGFSALASSSASTLVSACFWRARHWLVPRWWLPRAWPAGSALLADPSLSALSLGAPRRHFFGSDASQAAELSLLGFPGGAGVVR